MASVSMVKSTVFQFTPLREGRRDARGQRHVRRYFNSRPSARGDAMRGDSGTSDDISIHAPPRGATTVLCQLLPRLLYFNSRPSARGDFSGGWWPLVASPFQFTPLREGRRKATKDKKTTRPFQFTPLREGRRQAATRKRRDDISIHAPPRGATKRPRKGKEEKNISIHAPPRGATTPGTSALSRRTISIHAPPRGATRRPATARTHAQDFNSRPSARGDVLTDGNRGNPSVFQFTPLREGRRQKICNFCKSFVQPLQISMA